ncbi:RNA polymerase sigma factor [Streptomyces tanashiensis]
MGADETELADKPADSDTAGEALEALAAGDTMQLVGPAPQDQAEAVVLRVVVGLDAKSAADTLGKRPGAVRTAAHRGLEKLAELLGADGGQDGPDGTDGTVVPLDGVPPQRGRAPGSVAPRGVTQSRPRTQKDM